MKIQKTRTRLLAFGLSVSLLFQTTVPAAEETPPDQTASDASVVTTNQIPGWPQGPDISATAAIVLEDSTDTVLYEKNADQPLFPGSTVKIMTMLLALESSSPEDTVIVTETGASAWAADGGANIAAQVDEEFTMEQCLYAIMLASANDIATQVAEHIGGSVEAFVAQMNARAAELGCTNTVFTNPTGLPDENQHITARDMALIMEAAMQNDTFRSIAAASSYTIPATNMSGGERVLTNSFAMKNSSDPSFYSGCLGGKEGYTDASGSTLVCAAEKNDMTLIAVVLQGASGQTSPEAVSLLDYGFGSFQFHQLGKDDFSLLSGGLVIGPVGAAETDFTTEDTETDDHIDRQYFFGGIPVGTAVLQKPMEPDTSLQAANDENIQAAMDFSRNKSNIPYILIAGGGIVLLALLLFLMRKVLKS